MKVRNVPIKKIGSKRNMKAGLLAKVKGREKSDDVRTTWGKVNTYTCERSAHANYVTNMANMQTYLLGQDDKPNPTFTII